MPRIFISSLSIEDRKILQMLIAQGDNWRERDRAQTLLYLGDALATAEVAQLRNIHTRNVGSTGQEWFKSGFDSLPDLPRRAAGACGAAVGSRQRPASAVQQPLRQSIGGVVYGRTRTTMACLPALESPGRSRPHRPEVLGRLDGDRRAAIRRLAPPDAHAPEACGGARACNPRWVRIRSITVHRGWRR
jgi:hypothetical protein